MLAPWVGARVVAGPAPAAYSILLTPPGEGVGGLAVGLAVGDAVALGGAMGVTAVELVTLNADCPVAFRYSS